MCSLSQWVDLVKVILFSFHLSIRLTSNSELDDCEGKISEDEEEVVRHEREESDMGNKEQMKVLY